MDTGSVPYACAVAARRIGRRVRALVHAMPPAQRMRRDTATLKVRPAPHADRAAEDLGIEDLERLSRRVGYRIELLADSGGATRAIGRSRRAEVIWAYFDAIDGTIKVASIGQPTPARFRAANDGAWACALAFTAPTKKTFDELVMGDFVSAAIVDANPPHQRTYPAEVLAAPERGRVRSYDVSGVTPRRVFTSSHTRFNEAMVFLDVFQAYDRDTRLSGDEELAIELYRILTNRHDGGAFDVLRQFANLSALVRLMLGWRDSRPWYESQGGAFVVVNENLANLIPAVPIIAGAGGTTIDFDGRPIRDRRVADGRTSIIHAANAAMRAHALRVVAAARRNRPPRRRAHAARRRGSRH